MNRNIIRTEDLNDLESDFVVCFDRLFYPLAANICTTYTWEILDTATTRILSLHTIIVHQNGMYHRACHRACIISSTKINTLKRLNHISRWLSVYRKTHWETIDQTCVTDNRHWILPSNSFSLFCLGRWIQKVILWVWKTIYIWLQITIGINLNSKHVLQIKIMLNLHIYSIETNNPTCCQNTKKLDIYLRKEDQETTGTRYKLHGYC